MKAFCLAFAFLLASLPAIAEELPQTGNAWRATEPDLAEPGNFKWTVVDDAAGGPQAPAAATDLSSDKGAPARAALEKIRAETARIFDDARKTSMKVSRIRYDLRVRCVVEQIEAEPDMPTEVSMPYIWGASEEREPETAAAEYCEVDYSQKVRSEAEPQPQASAQGEPAMVGYDVAVPVN